MNLEIVENSNSSCANFNFLPDKLNFCCGNYLREETIQRRKLYEEIRYFILTGQKVGFYREDKSQQIEIG